MDPVPPKYAASAPAVAALVRAQPFGWIVSGAGPDARATPLPLRSRLAPGGQVEALVGHFARRNPQVEALRQDPRALILMLGAHGYVSPSWMADRAQAPTWNYASAQFQVEIAFMDDGAALRAVLDDLIGAMEKDRPNPWSAAEMGERYASLSRGIIAFEARVLEARGVFKLGQDERDDVYVDILGGLEGSELADWMCVTNPGRGSERA